MAVSSKAGTIILNGDELLAKRRKQVEDEQAKEEAAKAMKKASNAKRAARAARMATLKAKFTNVTEDQWKAWMRGLGGYMSGSKSLDWAVKWVGKKMISNFRVG